MNEHTGSFDRIDIHIVVPRVEYEKLSDQSLGEPSAVIQKRVEAARQIQRDRFGVGAVGAKQPNPSDNTSLDGAAPTSSPISSSFSRLTWLRRCSTARG